MMNKEEHIKALREQILHLKLTDKSVKTKTTIQKLQQELDQLIKE